MRPMTAAGFPPTADKLADKFLQLLQHSGPIQWSHAEAKRAFIREVARSHPHLLMICAQDQKAGFCDELARLVNMGVLPNLTDANHIAFVATRTLLAGVGLAPVNPALSLSQLETQFNNIARPKGLTPPLAQFLSANWN